MTMTAAHGTSYAADQWHDLFVMAGGATAALAGLIFVSLSVNHQQIVTSQNLRLVAARTLAVLICTVVMCALALAPTQPPTRLGLEQLINGAALFTVVLVSTVRSNHGSLFDQLDDWCVGALATLPLLIGGASLLASSGGGLYWLLAQTVAALIAATYYAWFLLIDIRR